MGIIIWIIFGGLAGLIASLIMNTDAEQGLVLNVVVGIIGAVIGGWLMSFLGESNVTGFNPYSLAVAILGSVIFIVIIKAFNKHT